jgi:hypothetical protein
LKKFEGRGEKIEGGTFFIKSREADRHGGDEENFSLEGK